MSVSIPILTAGAMSSFVAGVVASRLQKKTSWPDLAKGGVAGLSAGIVGVCSLLTIKTLFPADPFKNMIANHTFECSAVIATGALSVAAHKIMQYALSNSSFSTIETVNHSLASYTLGIWTVIALSLYKSHSESFAINS